MTAPATLTSMMLLTLRAPGEAAAVILSRPWPRDALWSAVVVISVVNTWLATLSNYIFPVPEQLQTFLASPFLYFTLIAGGFVLMVHALFWTGRMLGGAETMGDLLTLMIWLQVMRTVAQAVMIVLILVSPVLASFVMLFVGVATLWIFMHFLNIGLKLNSMMRAFGVLIVGTMGLLLSLSILFSIIGVAAIGVPPNV